MHIEAIYYQRFPDRTPIEPRSRFKQYYRDLHSRYHTPLDETTFTLGSQYKFHELGYSIFDCCAKDHQLETIDLTTIAYWAHEFDPDYASCGTHFAHHYHLNCNLLDVIDQGSICTLTALTVINQYQKNLLSKKALCLALDQDSIPRADRSSIPIPTNNASAAIILNREQSSNSKIEILNLKIWNELQLCDANFDILALLIPTLADHQIKLQDCIVCCKRNTFIYRAIKLYQHAYQNHDQPLIFYHSSLDYGCTEIFKLIHLIDTKTWDPPKKLALIFDEDVESLNCGFILLKLN